jgi:Ca2+-binding RTX toxin-like protein
MSREALERAKFLKEVAQAGINDDVNYFVATSRSESFRGFGASDTVSYENSATGVWANLHSGSGSGGLASNDTFAGIENLVGSKFDDVLSGDYRSNIFYGWDGHDVMDGGAGGADRLFGGAGNDTLRASGARGETDVLNGGSGVDTLKFTTQGGSAEITTGTGADHVELTISDNFDFRVVIKDFQPHMEADGGVVTNAEWYTGDRLALRFENDLGTDEGALAEHVLSFQGDDMIMTFTHPNVNGEIVFEDFALQIPSFDWMWRMDASVYAMPLPV